MKNKMTRLTTVLMITLAALLLTVPLQQAFATTYYSPLHNAITNAANRLVNLQSPIDYGWDWIVTGLTSHSANPSATNIYGVTAMGLIDAALMTGNATLIYDSLNTAFQLMVGDPTNKTTYWRTIGEGKSFDYKFLDEITLATMDAYGEAEYAYYGWHTQMAAESPLYGNTNQSALFNDYSNNWIGTGYYGLGAWGFSDWGIQLCNMVNIMFDDGGSAELSWINNSVKVIHNNINNIALSNIPANAGNYTNDYVNLGIAWALNLLVEAYYTSGHNYYPADITTLENILLANQNVDGTWSTQGAEDIQATAYAVVALLNAGDPTAQAAAQKGAEYLIANQLPNGGWLTGGDEISEVDSECLEALVTYNSYFGAGNDVAISGLTISAPHLMVLPISQGDIVQTGDTIHIAFLAQNLGIFDQTFNVALNVYNPDGSLNTTLIADNPTLGPGASKAYSYNWVTTGYSGGYRIAAIASPVPFEVNTANNEQDIIVSLAPSIPTVPVVSLVPSTKTWMTGGTFDVNVTIADADTYWGLAGYSATIGFNSSVVQVASISQSSYLGAPASTINFTNIDNVTGQLTFAVSQLTPVTPATSGVLFTITFTAMGVGSCNLTMLNVELDGAIDPAKWVSVSPLVLPLTTIGGHVTIVPPMPGDLNLDGKISLADLVLLAKAYGSTPSSPNWNPAADINHDGKVSLTDLVLLASHYGTVYLVDP